MERSRRRRGFERRRRRRLMHRARAGRESRALGRGACSGLRERGVAARAALPPPPLPPLLLLLLLRAETCNRTAPTALGRPYCRAWPRMRGAITV